MYNNVFSVKDIDTIMEIFLNKISKEKGTVGESKKSFDYTYKYFSAINNNDFSEQMNNGLRLIILMYNTSITEPIKKNLKYKLTEYTVCVEKISNLYKDKKYAELISENIGLKPVPPILLKYQEDARKEMDKSMQLYNKAKNAADTHPIRESDEIVSSIEEALKIWPYNTLAIDLKNTLYTKYTKLWSSIELISSLLGSNSFDAAFKELDNLKKEYQTDAEPNAFAKLEAKINTSRNNYDTELKKAQNYVISKNYREALKIYDKLNTEEQKKPVYELMLTDAKNEKQWEKAVALLEKLERWEEAGKLRTENKIKGKVFLREKLYSAGEVFENSKANVVIIVAEIGYGTVSGSGFAVTRTHLKSQYFLLL